MSAAESPRFHFHERPHAAAADLIAHLLAAAGDRPRLAVPGGSAAAVLAPLRDRLGARAWGTLRVTWVDERRVPSHDTSSNRGAAHRAGWLGAPAPVGLELPLWLDDDTPAAATARVTRALARDFGGALDVVLLGMGEDGHVASLFPGHAALDATEPVTCVDDAPKPPPRRITLCLPLLTTARAAVLVTGGAGKQDALRRLHAGDRSLPAARLPRLQVVTDVLVR